MRLKNVLRDKWMYIAAFTIPWILICIHSVTRNGWPFYDGSIYFGDSGIQFYQMYVELWNKIHEGQSLFYTWNAGGGVDFYTNMGYYLISPFTLIILAVPKTWLNDVIQVVMILKWSGIYVSMVYYFMHTGYNRLDKNKGLVSFVLASIYTLSNHMIFNVGYFIWNDVMILFPLLLLAIEKMVRDISWKGYCVLLWMAIIFNFYPAYQVCLFLVIWFLIQLRKDTPEIRKKIGVFVGSSLLSGLMSFVVLLPCLLGNRIRYSSEDGIRTLTDKKYISSVLVTFWKYIKKLFIFDDISDFYSLEPKAYISVGAIALLMLYVGSKSVLKRRNIILMIFLISGLFFGAVSYVWHGFSTPHGIYHRYFYIIVFVSVFIILDLIQNLETLNKKSVIILGIIELILMIVSFIKIDDYQAVHVYYVTFLLFILYQIILMLYIKNSINSKHLIAVFSFLILVELSMNAYAQLSMYDVNSIDDSWNTKDAGILADKTELSFGERLNVLNGLRNLGLVFDKGSDDIFLSLCNGNNIRLHKALGMDCLDDLVYELHGASPLLNLIFNQRYGIGADDYLFSDEELIEESNGLGLYRMQRLAGLGYMTNSEIEQWNPLQLGPFNAQNQFAYLTTGEKGLFDVVPFDIVCKHGDTVLEAEGDYIESGYYVYDYEGINDTSTDQIIMETSVPYDMDLYIAIDNGDYAYSHIWIDDEKLTFIPVQHYRQTYHLGKLKTGQSIRICTEYTNVGRAGTIWYHFGNYNEEVFQKVYDVLSKNVYEIDEMDSDYIDGHIHADKDGIMVTSIQAVDGFSVFVDNKEVEYKTIGKTFIGVPIEQGEHRIEFKYITPYFKEGLYASIGGLLIYIILCVYTGLRRKTDSQNEKESIAAE